MGAAAACAARPFGAGLRRDARDPARRCSVPDEYEGLYIELDAASAVRAYAQSAGPTRARALAIAIVAQEADLLRIRREALRYLEPLVLPDHARHWNDMNA